MHTFRVAIFLISAAALLGCEESVNPILETNRQFTLFGTLDMASDTQFVRVIDIRPTLTTPPEVLEASFSSLRVSTGEKHVWKDSVHTFDDGSVGHIFYTPLRVFPGETYTVEAVKPGRDLVTSASTTLPSQLEAFVQQEVIGTIFTTQVTATQSVRWADLDESPFSVSQWYRFFTFNGYNFLDIRLNHTPSESGNTSGEYWELNLDLVRDRDSIATNHPELFTGAYLVGLGMIVTRLDAEFVAPGGVFTVAALSQPGTLSNVTNGFGYVGSVGRFTAEWVLKDTTAVKLGYQVLRQDNLPHLEILDRVWEEPIGTFEHQRE